MAAESDYAHIAQLLLDAGASSDRATRDGVTPLMIAARNGSLSVVQTLVGPDCSPAAAILQSRFWGSRINS